MIIGGIFTGEVNMGPILLESPDYYTNYITKLEWEGTTGNSSTKFDELQVNIFPNPVSDQLHVFCNCNDSFQYELINTIGNIVIKGNAQQGSEKLSIDISKLPKGLYYLNIISDTKRISEKIIKN